MPTTQPKTALLRPRGLIALAVLSMPLTPALADQQAGREELASAPTQPAYAFEPAWASVFDGIYNFTQPSKDAMMGFSQPTEVRQVLVKTGDRVQAGDVLVRARDADVQATYRLQQRRAENRYEILDAENRLELARIEFDNQQSARDQGGGSTVEYDRAKANLEAARIAVEAAKESFIEQGILLERQAGDLERYAVTARFDGTVAAVEVVEGQAMQDGEPVLRLVAIDPLQVRVPTPTAMMLRLGLERGDRAWVAVNVAGQPRLIEGKITSVSPVADFGSDKVFVEVELPNPDRLLSGLPAYVRFEEPTEAFTRILNELQDGERQTAGAGSDSSDRQQAGNASGEEATVAADPRRDGR